MNLRRPAIFLILAVTSLAVGQNGPTPAAAAPVANGYSLQPLIPDAYLGANGSAVIEFAMIPGRPNEAIVVRQSGHIYRVALDGSFAPALWGNVSAKVNYDGEEGLLAVAFAPNFLTSGRVYLYYTPGSPTPTVLARYTATATDLNEASEEVLLNIEEFASNHNGGHIAFDSDGYLYLSIGDGGGANDPNEKGQALDTLLGKVLRLDVSGPSGYAIPSDNPFSDGAGPIREEIFAYGFRNPFRMTIDPPTNDVWLGDVGQGDWEEVDRVIKGGNYGWDCYEGNHSFEPAGCPGAGSLQFPRAEYGHTLGQSVVGGAVYRGTDVPALAGWYVYGDFYSGRIWAVNPQDTSAAVQLTQAAMNISAFTLMADGEIVVVTYDTGVHRLVPLDADGDGRAAISDNCPNWPNASQTLPNWPVPNDDPDCDGWTRAREDFVGTKRLVRCSATGVVNDEPLPDAWPVDFNDNRLPNGADILSYNSRFGSSAAGGPPYDVRWDLNASGLINGADILQFNIFFGKFCT
jgi:glucose/arabinose dehydrogenase